MNLFLRKLIVDICYYLIPLGVIILIHVDFSDNKKSIGFFATLLILILTFLYMRKKNKIMKIKETKEIEDGQRKISTILFYYIRFAIFYMLLYASITYIEVNFSELILTLQLIAISLITGVLFRIDLANKTGL
jgi:hypothetical protein